MNNLEQVSFPSILSLLSFLWNEKKRSNFYHQVIKGSNKMKEVEHLP